MTTDWRPLSGQRGIEGTLHEGIPAWLATPLNNWIDSTTLSVSASRSFVHVLPTAQPARVRLVAEFDLKAHMVEPLSPRVQSGLFVSYVLQERDSAELTLDFVDFLLMRAHSAQLWAVGASDHAKTLEDLLRTAGSAWRAGSRGDFVGLERRVPDGVQVAAHDVISSSKAAGHLLAEAWHAAYGRTPDPEEAYEKAIKAVEEAGAHVVSPKNEAATLGTMARDMENQGDWSLPLIEVEKHPSNDAATKMLRALWSGQESRHGGNGYRKPTQAEAEAAVMLAVGLVQFFAAGLISRLS